MWKNLCIACWQAVHEDIIGDTSFYSFHDHRMLDVCGLIVLIWNCAHDVFLSECVLCPTVCAVRAEAHEEEIKALIEPCLKFLQRRGQGFVSLVDANTAVGRRSCSSDVTSDEDVAPEAERPTVS